MALTLDPALAAAQDSASRRPIVSLTSESSQAEIPFLGTLLDASATAEGNPAVIAHSTGALCGILVYGNNFRFFYTDAARTVFSFVDLTVPSGDTAVEATLAELADGNVGLVLFCTDTTYHQKLYRMKLSPTGEVLTSFTAVLSYLESAHLLSCPFVVRLASGFFFLAYIDKTVSGATYAIRYRTSADFVTWSAEGTCSIGGLTDTKRIVDLSLLQISTGELWLWFTYVDSLSGTNELSNIYFSTSSDGGSTWSAASKFTNYATYDTVGTHPFSAQKIAGQMHLFFNEKTSCLHLDGTAAGYCGDAANLFAQGITFDSVNRKLYLICIAAWNNAALRSVVRVDVDTWTIDACWNLDTTPGFNQLFEDYGSASEGSHGEGSRIAVASGRLNHFHIEVLDGEADTITPYHFHDWADYGVTRNVNWTSFGESYLSDVWIDGNSDRMYVVLLTNPNALHIGYIDLTETINPGDPESRYTFHDVVTSATGLASGDLNGFAFSARFQMAASEDLILLPCPQNSSTGRLVIYNLSSGGIYKNYSLATHPGFPKEGLTRAFYYDGKVYGVFRYDSSLGEEDKRGLCVIDLATDSITFKRPSWGTYDDYYLIPMVFIAPDKLVLSSRTHGVTIFNINSETWELLNNDSVPGMDTHNLDADKYSYGHSSYDSTTGIIFTSSSSLARGGAITSDLTAFSYLGSMYRSVYQVGTYTDSWAWGATADFIEGLFGYDAAVALDPNRSIYAFWTERELSEYSIKWGQENASLDLSPYLVRGREIAVRRTIDGTPSEMRFAVSSGHLFDVHNATSLFRIFLKKGRKLVLQLGERVAGVDYFQDQGSYLVSEVSLRYQRGEYPQMEVTAKDRTSLWDHLHIIASASYSDYPEDILADLLEDFAGFSPSEIDLPTFDERRELYQQWMNVMLKDVADQVCNRFGYFPRIDVANKFAPRKIGEENSVDHTYSDQTKMIDFSPDDRFSDFTNRVIVEGYERDYIAVLFAEERVGTLNGTVGWWGFKKDYTVYYSPDASRTCRSPRLAVVESAQSIAFSLAGRIEESISYIDPDEKYCIVTVESPNLIPEVLAGLAIYVGGCLIPDSVVVAGFIGSGGFTIPIGRLVERVGLVIVILALAAVGNFQYEIWAQPIGYVRRSIQQQDDDEELQAEINAIVLRKIQDPLVDNVADCLLVARFEMMVARCQRKRVSFSKVAHLQDEEGDTLQILHPYSNLPMKVFVTDLTRKMLLPAGEGGDGYFTDEVEGWNVT